MLNKLNKVYMKLKEILEKDHIKEDMDLHVDTCRINTEHEIIKVREDINKQQKVINLLYRKENFSASEIYTAKLKLDLLEKKKAGLEEMLKDLF